MEIKIKILKGLEKVIKSKSKSTKEKYNNILTELSSTPFGGPYYIKYKGESLINEVKKRKGR